jgi:lipopolysaccharide export system protein LptA
MISRNPRSTIIIAVYLSLNVGVILLALNQKGEESPLEGQRRSLAPEYTQIEHLDYFHLRAGVPKLSLSAESMRSQGEEVAEFELPRGVYSFDEKDKTLKYSGLTGLYRKSADSLTLQGSVKVTSDEAVYLADKVEYQFAQDLVLGTGSVNFNGEDPRTRDKLEVEAQRMRAHPKQQLSRFDGEVRGSMLRKRQYEGKMTFASDSLQLDGPKSLAQLVGNVRLQRPGYLVTGGNADIFLENYNKSLKYFVMNDDVKMTETVQTPQGVVQRRAYAERLEGFGREQKMVLSGAPRVEQGEDVIKGYRITVRENVDLIEVDDAMSDVQVKQKKLKD